MKHYFEKRRYNDSIIEEYYIFQIDMNNKNNIEMKYFIRTEDFNNDSFTKNWCSTDSEIFSNNFLYRNSTLIKKYNTIEELVIDIPELIIL